MGEFSQISFSKLSDGMSFLNDDIKRQKEDIEKQKYNVTMLQERLMGYEATKSETEARINMTEQALEYIQSRLNRTVTLVHQCACCGAHLEIPENKPVFHCKYCNATYLIGTLQLNSNY